MIEINAQSRIMDCRSRENKKERRNPGDISGQSFLEIIRERYVIFLGADKNERISGCFQLSQSIS